MRRAFLPWVFSISLFFSGTSVASYIYWTEGNGTGGHAIARANLDGTGAIDLVSGLFEPQAVAVTNSFVYWTGINNDIQRANLDGTGITTLVTGQPTFGADGLVVTDNYLYWSQANGSGGHAIGRANLDGTGAVDLITGLFEPQGLAVTGSHIYMTNLNGKIQRANLDGTGLTDLITSLPSSVTGLAVNSNYLFWTEATGSHKVKRANLDGTGITDLVTGLFEPQGIEVDDSFLYFTTLNGGGDVRRANLDGTGMTTLVTGVPSPTGIAVSGVPEPSRVFFVMLGLMGLLVRRHRS